PRFQNLRPSGCGLTACERRAGVLFLRGLDHVLGQTRRQPDGARSLLSCLHVGGSDVDDPVGVDLERHLDAHLATVADAEAGELEFAQQFALRGLARLPLVDADLHLLLAVAVGGVRLRFLDRDRRVLVDDLVGVPADSSAVRSITLPVGSWQMPSTWILARPSRPTSILARSDASFSICRQYLFNLKSMPCCFRKFSASQVMIRSSKSSPPRYVSPAVDKTSNTSLPISSTEISH